jgi:ankyrin repeat protein
LSKGQLSSTGRKRIGVVWTLLTLVALVGAQAPAAVDQHDADGLTVLMRAAARGDLARVNDLLAKGAKPDTRSTQFAVTALMCASYFGHAPVVEALLARGADVKLQDGSGAGAIDWALIGGRKEVEDLLRRRGGALNPFLQVMNMALGLMETAGKR